MLWMCRSPGMISRQRNTPSASLEATIEQECRCVIPCETCAHPQQAHVLLLLMCCCGPQGTLHRISALRNRKGTVVGLTCRVGRAVTGHIDMIRDMIEGVFRCRGGNCAGLRCSGHSLRYSCHTDVEARRSMLAAQSRTRFCSWAVRVSERRRSSERWHACWQMICTNASSL